MRSVMVYSVAVAVLLLVVAVSEAQIHPDIIEDAHLDSVCSLRQADAVCGASCNAIPFFHFPP